MIDKTSEGGLPYKRIDSDSDRIGALEVDMRLLKERIRELEVATDPLTLTTRFSEIASRGRGPV